MPDSIHTHSVGAGFAISDDIILNQTARTRTIFRPGMHGGGVRGHIIRQKIGANGEWADANEVNFNSLPADCGIQIELDTDAIQKLFTKLEGLYRVQGQGVRYGDHNFVVAKENEVVLVNDQDKARVIQALLDQDASEDFWAALGEANPDLAAKLAAGRVQYDREQTIHEFEAALAEHPDDEAFWQAFFGRHPWILQSVFSSAVYLLGEDVYIGGKGPVGRQGVGGVATDFLFSDDSTKSFSVVEIKTPQTPLMGSQYRGAGQQGRNNEVYSMHAELSGGVVQTRNQIAVAIDNFEAVLGPGFEHRINRAHPKGVLVIGTLDGLSERQRESFNQFRHGLSLSVITYDELLKRLKLLFMQPTMQQLAVVDEVIDVEVATTDEVIDLDEIPF